MRALPKIDKPIRWELIAIAALVGVPVVVALKALEFRLMAQPHERFQPIRTFKAELGLDRTQCLAGEVGILALDQPDHVIEVAHGQAVLFRLRFVVALELGHSGEALVVERATQLRHSCQHLPCPDMPPGLAGAVDLIEYEVGLQSF